MTIIRYSLPRPEYLKLARVLPRLAKNGNMISSNFSGESACLIDRTGALFFYDGHGTVRLGARRVREIRQTESLIERMAKVTLTKF